MPVAIGPAEDYTPYVITRNTAWSENWDFGTTPTSDPLDISDLDGASLRLNLIGTSSDETVVWQGSIDNNVKAIIVEASEAQTNALPVGDYAMMLVVDNGGLDEEVFRGRIVVRDRV